MEPYSFATSTSLHLPVSVKVNYLDGQSKPIPFSVLLRRPDLKYRGSNLSPVSELYVTVQLWADSKPLSVPSKTAYKTFKTARTWNEWLSLPIDYSTVPLSSQLAVTVWDLSPTGGGEEADGHAVPFGGTTISLFDEDNTLRKGRQRCYLHRHRAADGLSNSTTPHAKQPQRRRGSDQRAQPVVDERTAEMERLEALMKKHEMGEIPENKWLDQLVFRKIEKLDRAAPRNSDSLAQAGPALTTKDRAAPQTNGHSTDNDRDTNTDADNYPIDDGRYFLFLEFPRFDHPIVFTDFEYPAPPISSLHPQTASSSDIRLKPPPEIQPGPGLGVDHDENGEPVGKLIRIFDPEAGVKDNPAESKHRRLVRHHRTGVLDRDLKPNAIIRDELNLIMSYDPTHSLSMEEKDLIWKFRYHLTKDKRALTKFLKSVTWTDAGEARQAVQILPRWSEIDVGDALELLGAKFDNASVRAYAVDRLRKADDEELLNYLLQLVQALKFEGIVSGAEVDAQDSSLAKFLISRAADNMMLGNYLHWYLMVECDDRSPDQGEEYRKLFARVEYDFMTELEDTEDGPERRKTLLRQGELITVLSKISKDIRFSREDRTRKIERLKSYLADPKNDLLHIDPPLPLPLDPSVMVVGCFPDEVTVFKSSLFPLLINFKTSDGRKYPIIFKTGDDLRQDQLVIQIITLMDRLLLKENLDLRLSPYRILATSTSAGAVQFVESKTLDAACKKHKGSLLGYLRANNPDESGPLGVRKETMDTYVKSCAGYCVITYLLGVGDRHLDNLLVAPDGHFFHADFGYILGRDPKPFAPLMKLSKEMIEGMGGEASSHYQAFKQYCFTAYTTLRKSSNLILNLFALMVDANIPDIRLEPDKAVLKVRERFHLELSEEEAIRHFEALIQDSVTAFFPVVIDRLHGLVQQWRT